VKKYQEAIAKLEKFMADNGLTCEPAQVVNLKGDTAKAGFITRFKDVQKFKTQLEQYTDLDEESKATIEASLPTDTLRGFKAMYLDTALLLRRKQGKDDGKNPDVEQLEFELVLFASALIDYDYIMGLIAKSTQADGKEKMTLEQIIDMMSAYSNLEGEKEDLTAYLQANREKLKASSFTVKEIRDGFEVFKAQKASDELAGIATQHGLQTEALQAFVDAVMERMIFDGEQLTDLLSPLGLGWKQRRVAELALMEQLAPYLNKLAGGREISGLNAYE
jgi:type I restriction enzyme R subunit